MSVIGFVLSPENEFEKNISIPVANEDFFNKFWLPAAKELGLKWIPTFSIGMDVLKEDVPAILDELSELKAWAITSSNLHQDEKKYMVKRIELFREKLPQVFRRENAVMFIG